MKPRGDPLGVVFWCHVDDVWSFGKRPNGVAPILKYINYRTSLSYFGVVHHYILTSLNTVRMYHFNLP
jgi:hypothetical protein